MKFIYTFKGYPNKNTNVVAQKKQQVKVFSLHTHTQYAID